MNALTLLKLVFTTALTCSLSYADTNIKGAGASFPAPLYFEWADAYEKRSHIPVEYKSIGSSGGIKLISKRKVNFGASDKPLDSKEIAKYKLLQFPAVIGSIVVAYNVSGIDDAALHLKNSTVAEIFAGTIKRWNDPKIQADNPKLKLPDEKIVVVHRSDGSGVTYNFTHYLSASSEQWKAKFGTGKTIRWATGIGGRRNEGVAELIEKTPFSIGYIENAYKEKYGLNAATLQSANGSWVAAKEENFQAAARYASWSPEEHFYAMLTLQPGKNAYPIVAATFILLPTEHRHANRMVTAFFDDAFSSGDAQAKALGYIPLPKETKEMIREYWKTHLK